MNIYEIENQINHIDSRVARLEKINDEYMAKNGEMNNVIYSLIQKMMDERDILFITKLNIENRMSN